MLLSRPGVDSSKSRGRRRGEKMGLQELWKYFHKIDGNVCTQWTVPHPARPDNQFLQVREEGLSRLPPTSWRPTPPFSLSTQRNVPFASASLAASAAKSQEHTCPAYLNSLQVLGGTLREIVVNLSCFGFVFWSPPGRSPPSRFPVLAGGSGRDAQPQQPHQAHQPLHMCACSGLLCYAWMLEPGILLLALTAPTWSTPPIPREMVTGSPRTHSGTHGKNLTLNFFCSL